jgi:cobalt-zinc-cadmium efflux system membrane fusion protein
VTYRIPSLGERRYTAEVHVIGKEFNTENKTVRVHAHLVGDHPPFIRDLFAEARIWLDDATTPVLPEEAIFREGEVAYVFAGTPTARAGEVEFERVRVRTGATDGRYTAIAFIDPVPEGMRIVTQGAYYVYAQGQAGELGHEH